MISGLSTSDAPAYVPMARAGGQKPACDCGQPGCQCARIGGKAAVAGSDPQTGDPRNRTPAETARPVGETGSASAKGQLNEAELAMVRELKQRDQKVRQHEMAHLAASGGLARGGPSYSYQRGPDGQNYAVGGEVNIDISKGKTPDETVQKARTIRAAAMAPANPSGADRAIAARATQLETEAQMELVQQQAQERNRPPGKPGEAGAEDSPAVRLARRIFSAITPSPDPLLQVAA